MSDHPTMLPNRRHALAVMSASLGALCSPFVHAQAQTPYPARPVRMIVPTAAGSGSDLIARMLARQLTQSLGQPVIVENRAGASGMIGVEAVVRAPADGYTLLMSSLSPVVINPMIFKKLSVDPREGLVPVSKVGIAPVALLVNASLPAQTLAEFLALARKQELSYGSFGAGSGTHLGREALCQAAGVKMVHVPYRGTGPAVSDLLAGQISATMTDLATAQTHITSGKLRALAINGSKRSPLLPQVPTYTEQGFPSVEGTYASFALFAPRDTPAAIVQRLSGDVVAALKLPEMGERFREQGYTLEGSTPSQLAETLKMDSARWNSVLTGLGGLTLD